MPDRDANVQISETTERLLAEAGCPRCVGRFRRGEGPGSGWCAECKPYIEAATEIERLRGVVRLSHGFLWKSAQEDDESESRNLIASAYATLAVAVPSVVARPKCSCACHRPGMKVKHVVACCNGERRGR